MNNENIEVITDREELYDKCENIEQLFDNYYLPLLDKHYSKTYKLQQENEKLQHYKTLYQSLKKQKEELRSWLKEDKDKIKVYDTNNNKAVELGIVLGLGMCVEKMEELESVKK